MIHSIIRQFQRGSEVLPAKRQDITVTGEVGLDISLATGNSNVQYDLALTRARMKTLIIESDQDVKIETNSGSAADDTIDIKAGIPLVWELASGYYENPFSTADVTSIFVTNVSGATATITIRAGETAAV